MVEPADKGCVMQTERGPSDGKAGVKPGWKFWAQKIQALLSDAVLGFFALLAAELALLPVAVNLPAEAGQIVDIVQWAILGLFTAEYVCALAIAENKKEFVLEKWRILDLVIITAPWLTLLPWVGEGLRSAPALRLLRLLRVVAFAARAGGAMMREAAGKRQVEKAGPIHVIALGPQLQNQPKSVTWQEFLAWLQKPEERWFHVENVSREQFADLARVEGLSIPLLESCSSASNYPRLESFPNGIILSVWLPEFLQQATSGRVARTAVLMVAGRNRVVSVTTRPCRLPELLAKRMKMETTAEIAFGPRLALAFIKEVLEQNEEVAGLLEQQLRALEEVPMRENRPDFFEETFKLRKELSALRSDLWRLKGILGTLTSGRVSFPESSPAIAEALRLLEDQADYLYETVENLRDGLLSVLELHLNVVSFEMNKFMRLLAVVSVLGLIPAVVGGLLGMNLAGNPWPATLSQVTFGVAAAILLCLYIFLVKGWLK